MSNLQFLSFQSTRSSLRLGLQATSRSSFFETCTASAARSYSTNRTGRSGSRHPSQPTPLSLSTQCLRKPAPWRDMTANRLPCRQQHQHQQRRSIFGGEVTVLKNYIDIPPDYKDEDGLPFRAGDADLTKEEAFAIFGPSMPSPAVATRLCRILHGRRVAGTLEDPALRPNTAAYKPKQIADALAYLRRTVPVEEVINAGLRAEDELREIEEAEAWAVEEGAAEGAGGSKGAGKPNMTPTAEKWQQRLYRNRPKGDVYGVGVMDKIRARNEARWEEEQQRREEEKRLKEEEEARLNPGKLQKVDKDAPRELSPRMKEWHRRATSDLKEAPEMSKWERIWPSLVLAGAVVLVGGTLASVYLPPPLKYRLWPDLSLSQATVAAVVGVNALVWAAWKSPLLWAVLNRYFILVPATPRPFQVIGAALSHQRLRHLAVNMVFLWFLGTRLHDDVGRAGFLAVYLASGSVGFVGSLANMVLRGRLAQTSLGASGAVFGVATAYFMLHRWEGFKILNLPPDPYQGIQGLGFCGLILGMNILQLMPGRHRLDAWSHIAGVVTGGLYGLYLSKKMERERSEEEARHEAEVSKQLDLRLTGTVVTEEKNEAAAGSKSAWNHITGWWSKQ